MAVKVEIPLKKYVMGAMVPIVLVGGYFYPYLGYVVPVVMMIALATAAMGHGRKACGNYCPRGAFLTSWLSFLPTRPLPAFFKGNFRWVVMVGLMGFMVFRIAQNPTDPEHIGTVFWSMCVITTAIALVMALLYRQRAWCMICPIGKMSTILRETNHQIPVPEGCKSCKVCDKVCPIELKPSAGIYKDTECLQCGNCTAVCPVLKKNRKAA